MILTCLGVDVRGRGNSVRLCSEVHRNATTGTGWAQAALFKLPTTTLTSALHLTTTQTQGDFNMRHTTRRNALMPLVALYAVSLVPGAHAYCYRDRFGVEHCTLSTGARIGIAIAAVVGFLIVLMALRTARQRRTRQANMAYVNTSAVAGAVPPGYPPQGGPPGFPPPGAPPGFAPQGGPPGIPPRGGYPEYAPPQGPPPGSPPQAVYQAGSYFPYTQGAPAQYANAPNASPPQALQYPPQSYDGQASYAAPPSGPPPGWSPHPDYAAPTGPPPTGDHKHAV